MKKQDAERLVVQEWRSWSRNLCSPSSSDKLQFFSWLQSEKSELLRFRASGDKWQHVRGWIESHESLHPRT